jgi:hypothetical protein
VCSSGPGRKSFTASGQTGRTQPHPANAFPLENPFLAEPPAAGGAPPGWTGLRWQQSKTNDYANLERKTSSFAPEILYANRLIRSIQRGWSGSGSGFKECQTGCGPGTTLFGHGTAGRKGGGAEGAGEIGDGRFQ